MTLKNPLDCLKILGYSAMSEVELMVISTFLGSKWYELFLLLQMGMLGFVGAAESSITAPSETAIAKYLGIDLEVSVLVPSLFVWAGI